MRIQRGTESFRIPNSKSMKRILEEERKALEEELEFRQKKGRVKK